MFLIGSDPELFLENAQGVIVSAIGRIGGTKHEPIPVPKLGEGFSVQEDNVLCEYNTPPAQHRDAFVSHQERMREYLADLVGKQGLRLSTKASAIMPASELEEPAAWVFGCEPDFNAWELEMNPRPKAKDPALRSAGGHIHVGFDGGAHEKIQLCRWLDVTVGAFTAIHDPDTKRRELYGKAGAMRFKPYGLEYRTPSNWWTMSSLRTHRIHQLVAIAVEHANQGLVVSDAIRQFTLDLINNGDKSRADKISQSIGFDLTAGGY